MFPFPKILTPSISLLTTLLSNSNSGVTSVPLKDYDDIQLTNISKGYHEVVYNTTFFTYAPKAEDVYTTIRGTTLFVIRNKEFYEEYMPHARGRNYWNEAEKKTRLNVLLTVLSLLGYSAD